METTISALSLADLCIRYGKILVKTCKSYKHADQEIRESTLLIETLWMKIQRQLELLRNIWDTLDDDYQIHQNGVLQVLQGKAQAAITLVDSIVGDSQEGSTMRNMMAKKGDLKRLKYATWVKHSLKSVMLDLKEWADVFDISWYLILRQSSKEIDDELQPVTIGEDEPLSTLKSLRDIINSNLRDQISNKKDKIFLPDNFFDGNQTPISFNHSEAEIWLGSDSMNYILDQESSISTLSDSCKLARILQKVDPFTFGILSCRGLVKTGMGFTRFAFSIPQRLEDPCFLRQLLLSRTEPQPLDERFEIAKQLAKSVMFVHSTGFIHKNIRPETIIIFRSQPSDSLSAFLMGFERFRLEDANTHLLGDDLWQRNIYRHPTRQGIKLDEEYTMQHDIYSLGVCLLEIGSGESLVVSEQNGDPQPSSLIQEEANFSIKDNMKRAFEIKRGLVKIAREHLPQKMGRKYAETVITCLTCLDKIDNSFGDEKEFFDNDGVLVGVRFIEKILTTLLSLKV